MALNPRYEEPQQSRETEATVGGGRLYGGKTMPNRAEIAAIGLERYAGKTLKERQTVYEVTMDALFPLAESYHKIVGGRVAEVRTPGWTKSNELLESTMSIQASIGLMEGIWQTHRDGAGPEVYSYDVVRNERFQIMIEDLLHWTDFIIACCVGTITPTPR